MDPDCIERELRAYFAGHGEGLVAAYLYGSVARRTCRADSDVDVGLLYEAASAVAPYGLECDLQGLLGSPVQVVALNRAPVDLVHRVLRDGVLLLERDRRARVRFEVKARSEFFDLYPILKRYRAARPAMP